MIVPFWNLSNGKIARRVPRAMRDILQGERFKQIEERCRYYYQVGAVAPRSCIILFYELKA
jgi:hypothetical protein